MHRGVARTEHPRHPWLTEITATGAAYAAGLATGFWSGLDELRANYTTTRRWQPQMNPDERADGVRVSAADEMAASYWVADTLGEGDLGNP